MSNGFRYISNGFRYIKSKIMYTSDSFTFLCFITVAARLQSAFVTVPYETRAVRAHLLKLGQVILPKPPGVTGPLTWAASTLSVKLNIFSFQFLFPGENLTMLILLFHLICARGIN